MYRIPFSFYDFASYLTTGFFLLFALDSLLEAGWLSWEYLAAADGVLIFIITFILGHLSSQVAGWLISNVVVSYLGRPSKLLFSDKTGFFQSYGRPLPSEIRAQVLRKYYERTGYSEPGEGMFLHCFHWVKMRSGVTNDRLQTFIGSYGLARNLSFVHLLVAVLAGLKMLSTGEMIFGQVSVAALVCAYLLFLRYLKFYRHFAVEVYASYTVLKD